MPSTHSSAIIDELPPRLRPVVAPLVRWALGVSFGVLFSAALGLFAAWHALVAPAASGSAGVALVGQNFLPGYEPTVAGAFFGALWGFALGFAAGWLFAVVRNFVVWLSVHLAAWRHRIAVGGRALDDLM